MSTSPKILRSERLQSSDYHAQPQRKDAIVLHFTAGSTAAGAIATFRQKGRIATAYVIDMDGAIYELFPPECWAHHLGISGDATYEQDRRSIGVEIVNVGPLRLSPKHPGKLCFWPGDFSTPFCSIDSDDYVTETYRGFHWYAAYPAQQIAATVALVHDLCKRFSIPPRIPEEKRRPQFDPAFFRRYTGVFSHQNLRADKFDVGPAFPWNELLKEPAL